MSSDQKAVAREARRLLDARADVKELVQIGAYVRGTNPLADRALVLWPALEAFLQQDMADISPVDQSWKALAEALRAGPAVATLPPGSSVGGAVI